ncbi:hypothetical protein V2E39_00565 [Chryseobacterium arthrosphaerae]|uniref:Uncharacterized protein n=1 Tax=Chryseobacterium arthrosphaerae TaxID=651561 RepID=A0A1B8ZIX9_9FLAO|nr:hypothetical protein [Chryseobacterium arthrosphaerae]AYZ14703.1 hypothetical protein EGY05_23470 [Chryseobacterium arthrosphaerae]MDG4651334.1 hypothetical protein [Chryseobacterium arthrosphaerae]OCA71550.1 hypothetical protein BBI00_17720 [Chryseobacterium arthrosphaerae]UEQ75452.1 hypothetical protein J8N07_17560 [Chryseobacterium arthrosphaerae]
MKKTIYSCVAGFLSLYAGAQVGIGTSKPKAVLDVNGKTTLRKELRVGGTSTEPGSAGLNGQVLISQGEGLPPVWKSLTIPFMEEGQYKLINSYLSSDQTGISELSDTVDGDGVNKNSVGDNMTDVTKGKWKKIDGLTTNFSIKNGKNRLTYQFQTGIEIKAPVATTSETIRFACGVFRNNALVAVRPDRIASNNNSGKAGLQDYIFTLNYTEQNVPVGTHKVEIACRKIDTSNINAQFAIGRDVQSSNGASSAFTLESTMKIDVIEYVTYKN